MVHSSKVDKVKEVGDLSSAFLKIKIKSMNDMVFAHFK